MATIYAVLRVFGCLFAIASGFSCPRFSSATSSCGVRGVTGSEWKGFGSVTYWMRAAARLHKDYVGEDQHMFRYIRYNSERAEIIDFFSRFTV